MHACVRRVFWQVLAASLILIAAACQPAPGAQAPTLVPTIALPAPDTATVPATQPAETTAYPAGGEPQAGDVEATGDLEAQDDAYPIGPGLAGAPVIDNRSVVTARLIEQAPAADQPGFTLLLVEILSSEDIAGVQNFTREKVNQEIELLAETEQLPEIQPGENFTAEVAYRGDEHGAKFYAYQIEVPAR